MSDALDRLYAAPLEGFVALRTELAAELRKAGDTDGARSVAAAPKPSHTAWALDQVAHHSPGVLHAMFEARAAAAAIQKRGEADEVRGAVRDYRSRVADVLKAAREALEKAGFAATAAQLRKMSESLQAGSVEGTEARRLLEAGRLARDVDQGDPFAGLEAGPARRHKEEPPPRRDAKHEAKEAERREAARKDAERRLEEARERVGQLEAAAREARAEARRAETAAARAQADAERARRASEEVEARLAKAREELRAMHT